MKNLIKNELPDGTIEFFGTGWLPPLPDLRDYTEGNSEIEEMNQKLGIGEGDQKAVTSVDLRKWCSC